MLSVVCVIMFAFSVFLLLHLGNGLFATWKASSWIHTDRSSCQNFVGNETVEIEIICKQMHNTFYNFSLVIPRSIKNITGLSP